MKINVRAMQRTQQLIEQWLSNYWISFILHTMPKCGRRVSGIYMSTFLFCNLVQLIPERFIYHLIGLPGRWFHQNSISIDRRPILYLGSSCYLLYCNFQLDTIILRTLFFFLYYRQICLSLRQAWAGWWHRSLWTGMPHLAPTLLQQ